ncbi:glycosyltransferase family 4 protein [Roseicyclus elongatus]|uniref:glycosyltransferase family 4 protein n=1 Tax=Roseicyclus elongatus TaxID=159346 RepID=UPI0009FF1A38|nr:glycosyltransferase [Roseibacterium elongatum]
MTSLPDDRPAVFVWTPDTTVVNGQNIVTRRVVKHQNDFDISVFEYPAGGGLSIPSAFWAGFRFLSASIVRRPYVAYLVCARSTLGFVRDIPALLISRSSIRAVVHIHGSDFPELFAKPFVGRIAKWIYSNCEIILPSAHLVPQLVEKDFKRLVVCENFGKVTEGCPQSDVAPLRKDAEFQVLWSSNIMSSKGFFDLVDGMKLARKSHPKLCLVVLGRPHADAEKTEQEIKSALDELGLHDWVHLVGAVPPEAVTQYLEACDAVALPSTYPSECQPLSIIHAMTVGRKILVADTPALCATLGNYPAVFVDRTADSIAQGLLQLIESSSAKTDVTEAHRAEAEIRFSPSSFDARITKILRSP